jgi:tRNA-splicing ligase RtcB (3'-phosphate/5'-hydroxy nucleic acid ligase)
VYPYVALMPDHHPAEGSMVGSVIPTRNVLLPSVVGGDLGCGVTAVKLPVESAVLRDVLVEIRARLRTVIPTGSAHNAIVAPRVETNPLWRRPMESALVSSRLSRKLIRQFGSLGGGNHFLEFQQDTDGCAWIMLHSGSRYLGVVIRDYYIEAGRGLRQTDDRMYRLIPYLPADCDLADAYMADLGLAMHFARESRREMMLRALEAIAAYVPPVREAGVDALSREMCDVAHNYVAQEEHFGEKLFVHRKGAVRALEGELVMIPGSMGTSSYVAEGRGNRFAFTSCSHGAGRAMSRQWAARDISDRAFEQSMRDVLHDNDLRLKDESPLAYKNIQVIMRAQRDLVRVRNELTPLLSMKGLN